MNNFNLPKRIVSADGKEVGTTTGKWYHCRLEGCTGIRISTRWPGGQHTYPCSKGMDATTKEEWKIMS